MLLNLFSARSLAGLHQIDSAGDEKNGEANFAANIYYFLINREGLQ